MEKKLTLSSLKNIFHLKAANKILIYILNKFIIIYLFIFILINITKFRKTTSVFINSYAFGHSITETSIYFSEYDKSGICLSIGNKHNRNYYFKELYKPSNLLHFRIPNFQDINLYHAVRNRVHSIIKQTLIDSKIILIIIGHNLQLIDRDELGLLATNNSLARDFLVPSMNTSNLISEFDQVFSKSSLKHNSSWQYLRQQVNSTPIYLSPKLQRRNAEFMKQINSFKSEGGNLGPKVCTLVLRKSWKPWSGVGITGYLDTVNYLVERNYVIFAIGDLEDILKMRSTNVPNKMFIYSDFNLDPKLFQILAVLNSNFCIGEPSGAQAIVHFFGKRNLIINALPMGQHQYNSVILPRVWRDQFGVEASIQDYFDVLLYRIYPYNDLDRIWTPDYNSRRDVLEAVKVFVQNIENSGHISLEDNLDNYVTRRQNCLSRFIKNCYFSEVFLARF